MEFSVNSISLVDIVLLIRIRTVPISHAPGREGKKEGKGEHRSPKGE